MNRPTPAHVMLAAALAAVACSRKSGGAAAPAATTSSSSPAAPVAERSACPTEAPGLLPSDASLLIDDFASPGKLDGRTSAMPGLAVRAQFQATAAARFDPAPWVEPDCGAGAVHVKGRAADTGATLTFVLSTPAQGPGLAPKLAYDASARGGIAFRAALGNGAASRIHTLSVGMAGSKWSYSKDFVVTGTAWQDVRIPWRDLAAAPGAPPFSPAAINQIVFILMPGPPIDLYVDDLAFLPR